MTLAMLANQRHAEQIDPNHSVDKWRIFRALCEARPLLGISDRALAVLNALLSFYPGNTLSQETGLIIFPSNAQLSIRAHGIAPATLRRHLAALVDAGLLIRKDSPNGKRYARRGGEGEIGHAFGFSIAPLIVREQEILLLAAQVFAATEQLRLAKEELSLCRRDVFKLIETAQTSNLDLDFTTLSASYRGLISQIPRSPTVHHLLPILRDLEQLRAFLINTLENHANARIVDANESQIECHIKETNPESISESETVETPEDRVPVTTTSYPIATISEKHQSCPKEPTPIAERLTIGGSRQLKPHTPAFSLDMVLRACPDIASYAPGCNIRSARDLVGASLVVHTMLDVSTDAYRKACAVMGAETAATVIACILQRSDQIASAGGYLRDLTQRAEKGTFSVVPMLTALLKGRAEEEPAIHH